MLAGKHPFFPSMVAVRWLPCLQQFGGTCRKFLFWSPNRSSNGLGHLNTVHGTTFGVFLVAASLTGALPSSPRPVALRGSLRTVPPLRERFERTQVLAIPPSLCKQGCTDEFASYLPPQEVALSTQEGSKRTRCGDLQSNLCL